MTAFVWPVRVYFEDTDSGGVVYYANYLKYMERARTEWLRARGIEQDQLLADHDALFMVRSATIEYRRPARFNDLLEVHSTIAVRRAASVVFSHSVFNSTDSGGQLLCEAEIKIACVNATSGSPRPIPEFIQMEFDRVR